MELPMESEALGRGEGYPKPWQVTPLIRFGALVSLLLFFVLAPLTGLLFDPTLTELMARIPMKVVVFFDEFTAIGNSRWYLYPSVAAALLSFLTARYLVKKENAKRIWRWFAGACFFVFVNITIPGLLVAAIKWSLGRARPKLLLYDDIYGFDFFVGLEPAYNSFPSGHAQASLCIALAVGCFFKRLRPYLLAFAVTIAVSRIIVLVHFLSDVMASIAISLVLFWAILNFYREKGWLFTPGPDGRWVLKPEGRWIGRRLGRGFSARSRKAEGAAQET
jgi:membrane-associated phospholipid phosphatase